ncbi:MAG: SPOR domain-containing protein, partial [Bacteroidetes bacterium]
LYSFSGKSQESSTQNAPKYDDEYRIKFQKIRQYLGQGRTGEAYLLLQDLYKIDSANYYTNYLMGVCYTEQNIISMKSVKHLEYATKNILPDYGYIPYTERRAPMFAWYYLCKAYSQNGMCVKAKIARDEFLKIYENKNDYFTKNIETFLIECKDETWKTNAKKRKQNLVTKHVDYTVSTPLWGVQVGAFKELVPIREEFNDLKNVEAFIDSTGTVRYVVGRFIHKNQALKLRDVIAQKGYPDAFVVNVNRPQTFSEEIIIVDNISFKAHIQGKVVFRVQVGAFRDSIPNHLVNLYLQLEGIESYQDKDLTLMLVGNFDTYEEAKAKKAEIQELGISDAFIVAFNKGHKIPLNVALKHVEKMKLEEAERNAELRSKKEKRQKKRLEKQLKKAKENPTN